MSCCLAKSGSIFEKRNHVKRQIPRGEPRIFPFVRHRDDVAVEKVLPLAVAAVAALRRRRRLRGIAIEPVVDHVMVKLLAPKQPRVSLTGDARASLLMPARKDGVVEFVGLAPTLRKMSVETRQRPRGCFIFRREPQTNRLRLCPLRFRARSAAANFVPVFAGFTASVLPVHDVIRGTHLSRKADRLP